MKNINSRRAFLGKAASIAALAAVSPLASFGNGYQQAVTAAPKSSSPSDLKITDVKCGYVGGSLFVKIYTNQDIYGCGEGVDAIGGTYYLVQNMARRLRGQSPLNVYRIFEDIRRGGFFGGHSQVFMLPFFLPLKQRCGILPEKHSMFLFISYWVENSAIR